MSAVAEAPRRLDPFAKQKTSYCIDLRLRDEQVKVNRAATPHRLQPVDPDQRGVTPIAIVCYGPSLNDTWEQVRDFPFVMSCSGAHKFLIERGIVPTWHVDVDPREHKIALIGQPHPDVEYLIADTCHPKYFRLLIDGGFTHRLWNIFDGEDDAIRVLPPEEWALTGGCSVGLRALAIARFLGFTQMDVFGMDGCEGASGKHAAAHPNQAPKTDEVEYDGRIYRTTPGFLEAARQTAHEMDDLRDVTARFHGDGLVQAMMRTYQRKPPEPNTASTLAFNKPALISEEYRRLNAQLHLDNLTYGMRAGMHAETVIKLVKTVKTKDGLPPSVLDYGAGKGHLQKSLPFPVWQYDPAFPHIAESPRPADLVCCLDVLEHIEPDRLFYVLGDLRRCTKQIGYFVINTGPAQKTLADGRNTHLIQQPLEWWKKQLAQFFTVAKMFERGAEVHVLVAPLAKPVKPTMNAKTIDSDRTTALTLRFDGLLFRRDPYVIGAAQNVLDPALYQRMVETFPPIDLFKAFGGENRKWSLSTVNNPNEYAAFLGRHDLWREFHRYIKNDFIAQITGVLAQHHVEWAKSGKLKARWEFSLLPADGGCLRPHTDIASKLLTVVVSMRGGEAWDPAWGGGTDVLKPIRIEASDVQGERFIEPLLEDYKADWSLFNVVHTYPYVANQAVVFVKSDRSWHAVGPMQGPVGHLRKTLTINVERVS